MFCDAASCDKPILVTEFLVRGAIEYSEPEVFIAFEEPESAENSTSVSGKLKGMNFGQ